MAMRATEAELIELEKEYWRAIQSKDATAIARLTDDACILTGASGAARVDRQMIADMTKAGSYTLRDFNMSGDAQVRLLGDDVAIVAYRVHEELTVDGQPVALDAADASTWVRRDGRWVCAQHSEAISGDPFGRDRAGAAAVAGRALQADALLDRIETAAGALPDRAGRASGLVSDILQAVNGLRSLLGIVESH
jgi:uncharacterized protein (TIGR02246 family)